MENSLSFWEKHHFFNTADVVIIGGGIVGLSTALSLSEKNRKLKIKILERGILPSGASTRNAGFACFGSITELNDDLEKNSEEEVFALVQRRWNGLRKLRERVGDKNMDFLLTGNFEIFQSSDKEIFQKCLDSMSFFNKELEPITGQKETFKAADKKISDFDFRQTEHLILNSCEGQLNPGKMMRHLENLARQNGIEIINGAEVISIEDEENSVNLVFKQGWALKASRVVVATNGFACQLLPALEVQPARNQVIITKPVDNLKVKGCFHYDRGYFYFRNVEDRILLGGGRNLAEKEEQTDRFGQTDLIQNALEKLMKEVILPENNFQIDMRWSGILGVGNEKKPIIKYISPNVAVAVRMGGMGIAIGSLVGDEAAALILN